MGQRHDPLNKQLTEVKQSGFYTIEGTSTHMNFLLLAKTKQIVCLTIVWTFLSVQIQLLELYYFVPFQELENSIIPKKIGVKNFTVQQYRFFIVLNTPSNLLL